MDDMIGEFNVGCSLSVDVTHINNPHSFFVRTSKARDYMDEIESRGSQIPAEMVQMGQRVIFKSNILEKYVRGDIRLLDTDGEDTVCGIFAIDYGCFEYDVPIGKIHLLDERAEPENKCPPLAIHCRLYLCEPLADEFTEKVIDTMKSFIDEHTANINIISKINEQYVVELRTVECPRDIAMMLGLLGLTTFTHTTNTLNRFYNSHAKPQSSSSALNLTQKLQYKHKELKVGDILHIRVQSGNSLSGFYVIELNDYRTLVCSQPTYSLYCKEQRPILEEDVEPGVPCAVRVGNPPKYERALIKEVLETESKAVVKLVDWGNEIESHISNIKYVASEMYFTQPIFAIYCSTDEDQVWVTGLPKFLFPGYEFVIKIMELGNGFTKPHRVNIYPWKM